MPKSPICSVGDCSKPPRQCLIEGCGKRHLARGWCKSHYKRWRTYGDPLGTGIKKGSLLRFIHEVAVPFENQDVCLPWPFGRVQGYGQLTFDGREQMAHRVVCGIKHGPAPSHVHQAAHLCGKGHEGCCNPHHLAWKTPADNWADRIIHGTHGRGERHFASKLTEGDVREIRSLNGALNQTEIAKKFNTAPSNINRIMSRKRWSWLE